MERPGSYRFGEFTLDAARYELRRGGEVVEVQPKVFDLLVLLVSQADGVVPQREILAALWPDVVVSEASLSKAVAAARRALGDDSRKQAWIQTVRGRGFRFVGTVVAVARAPETAVAATEPATALVGRRDVLAPIERAVAEASAVAGRLVLLAGEAGVGKTSVAREAARRAADAGVRVLHGWCPEGAETPALWPWLRALRTLFEGCTPAEREQLAAGLGLGLDDLAALLPVLQTRTGAASLPREPLDPSQARFRLLDTATEILRRAASARATLVVLDDFHRADSASLALLEFVKRDLADAPLALLVAFREDELAEGHPLRGLARGVGAVAIRLSGLAPDEVAELAGRELDRTVTPAEARAIHEATGGNPFFVKELVRSLGAAPDGDLSAALGRGRLPSGVRELLDRRLASLAADCVELLQLAAVAGREIEPVLLARVADRPVEAVLESIEEAERSGVLRAAQGGLRFAHDLLRETLLARVPAGERAALHRRIGEALAALPAADAPAPARIAWHLCAGAAAGGAERAVEQALDAAAHATAHHAPDEALDLLRHAQGALAFASEGVEPLRLRLLLGMGESQAALGQRAEARASLLRALEAARALGDSEALARGALALGGPELSPEVGVHDPELVAALEEALGALPAEPLDLRVRVLVRLAVAVHPSESPERAERLAAAIVEVAETARDPAARAHALYGRRWLRTGPDELETRLAESDAIMRLGGEARRRELELAGRSCRFLDLVELGRLAEADRDLAAYARLAESLAVPRYRYRTLLYRTLRLHLDGRLAEAEALAMEALRLGQRFGAEDAPTAALLIVTTNRRLQGRLAEMAGAFDAALARAPSIGALRAAICLVQAEVGRSEEARAGLEASLRGFAGHARRDSFWIMTAAVLGECALQLGAREAAAGIGRVLAPYGGRLLIFGMGVVCWGAVDRIVGRLALATGDLDAAEGHLAKARRLETDAGARCWLGWTELARAELALRRGDGAAMARRLERARGWARALEMPALVRAADALRGAV